MTKKTEFARSFVPELEIRSAAKGGDGRTVEGIAVPYGRKQRINANLVEQFARGAFNHQLAAAHRVRFLRDHETVIGRAIELRDDAAGLWGAWRVSETPAGEETLTLIKDGVLDELSVGFRERQNRRLEDGTIERVTADLVEVSIVMLGAYGRNALVSAVRELQDHHDELAARCTCGAVETPNAERARQIIASLPVLPAVS